MPWFDQNCPDLPPTDLTLPELTGIVPDWTNVTVFHLIWPQLPWRDHNRPLPADCRCMSAACCWTLVTVAASLAEAAVVAAAAVGPWARFSSLSSRAVRAERRVFVFFTGAFAVPPNLRWLWFLLFSCVWVRGEGDGVTTGWRDDMGMWWHGRRGNTGDVVTWATWWHGRRDDTGDAMTRAIARWHGQWHDDTGDEGCIPNCKDAHNCDYFTQLWFHLNNSETTTRTHMHRQSDSDRPCTDSPSRSCWRCWRGVNCAGGPTRRSARSCNSDGWWWQTELRTHRRLCNSKRRSMRAPNYTRVHQVNWTSLLISLMCLKCAPKVNKYSANRQVFLLAEK